MFQTAVRSLGRYGAIYFWLIAIVFVSVSFVGFYVMGWSNLLAQDQLAWG
jgi:hypothetical protein